MNEPMPAESLRLTKTEGMTPKQAACNAARRALAELDVERSRLQAELMRNSEEREATRAFLAALDK